jgi:hypothetical protein
MVGYEAWHWTAMLVKTKAGMTSRARPAKLEPSWPSDQDESGSGKAGSIRAV